MYVLFVLTMPTVGSWNGQWSGKDKKYLIIKNFKGKKREIRANEIVGKEFYWYNFGDGWSAGIHAVKIEGKQAPALRKKSSGFCGYDWMVDSIITNLEIKC